MQVPQAFGFVGVGFFLGGGGGGGCLRIVGFRVQGRVWSGPIGLV